jgi:hypothetical protein
MDHAHHRCAAPAQAGRAARADRRARGVASHRTRLRRRVGVQTRPVGASRRGGKAWVPRLRCPTENAVPGCHHHHHPRAAEHRPADPPARLLDAALPDGCARRGRSPAGDRRAPLDVSGCHGGAVLARRHRCRVHRRGTVLPHLARGDGQAGDGRRARSGTVARTGHTGVEPTRSGRLACSGEPTDAALQAARETGGSRDRSAACGVDSHRGGGASAAGRDPRRPPRRDAPAAAASRRSDDHRPRCLTRNRLRDPGSAGAHRQAARRGVRAVHASAD